MRPGSAPAARARRTSARGRVRPAGRVRASPPPCAGDPSSGATRRWREARRTPVPPLPPEGRRGTGRRRTSSSGGLGVQARRRLQGGQAGSASIPRGAGASFASDRMSAIAEAEQEQSGIGGILLQREAEVDLGGAPESSAMPALYHAVEE